MGPLLDRASSTSIMAGLSQVMNGGAREAIPNAKGGINAGPRSHTTKARFDPLDAGVADGAGLNNTELGWGIVHLYRDGEETPGLGATSGISQSPTPVHKDEMGPQMAAGKAELQFEKHLDTTILCIPAVPSYMTPSDFLGWVGKKTQEEVSHFRMVMTGRMNRYLVLMKFRDAESARKWRQEWDGRVFGGLEVCTYFSYRLPYSRWPQCF
jgi:BRCA1-associated protein